MDAPSLIERLKACVPQPVKSAVRGAQRDLLLRRSVRRFVAQTPEAAADDEALLEDLVRGWGNEGWSGKTSYLAEAVRLAARRDTCVLECGTGLSTLLMGLAARARGTRIYALEHLPYWSRRIRIQLERYGLDNVVVRDAPLVRHEGFTWYRIADDDLPECGFDAAICDGPPSNTFGGRYGLMPILSHRLNDGCVILLDDIQRDDEQAIMGRWQQEFGVTVEPPQTDNDVFVKLTVAAGAPSNAGAGGPRYKGELGCP